MADKLLTRPEIKDYAETVGTTPATTGSVTFNLTTGNVFNLTPTGNVTIGFSNCARKNNRRKNSWIRSYVSCS